MVDIRFRAWDKLKKHMYYDVQDIYCDSELGDCFGDILSSPSKFEVMMYTGVTDDKDDEIYEDDIVAFEVIGGTRGVGYVRWDYERAMFLIDGGDIAFFDDLENIQILGNTYENPELSNKLHYEYRPKQNLTKG